MSATALILKELGWEVTGSDDNFYPPVSTYLENSGIIFFKGYRRENIPPNVNIVVIGKHAGLIPEKNIEVRAAFDNNSNIKSFPEILNEIIKNKEVVVVAGSYGKSTCTALIAWCLEYTGKNPGYFIGAIPHTPPKSSKVGTGDIFVIEGDEYPSSNWNNQSKFLYYHPHNLLLTSLSHDHLNVFKTVEDYRVPFKKLINDLPENGMIVACMDGNGVKETIEETVKKAIFYSIKNNEAEWYIANTQHGEVSSFDLIHKNIKVAQITTAMLGRYNIENIVGVAALVLSKGWLTPEQFVEAISKFEPLERRLNKLSEKTVIPVYEGFGSSLDKAISVIQAMKLHYPKHKLLILFEPHALSWCSPNALDWYAKVFTDASQVFIYKLPENHKSQLSLSEIVETVNKSGINATGFESVDEGLRLLKKPLNEHTAVLILSSGGFGGITERVVDLAERLFPKL